jgi:hypothetical protein
LDVLASEDFQKRWEWWMNMARLETPELPTLWKTAILTTLPIPKQHSILVENLLVDFGSVCTIRVFSHLMFADSGEIIDRGTFWANKQTSLCSALKPSQHLKSWKY